MSFLLNLFIAILLFPPEYKFQYTIHLEDYGTLPLEDDSALLVFYVTLKNYCEVDFEIRLNMNFCFEVNKCNSLIKNPKNTINLLTEEESILHSGSIQNFSLYFANMYLFNRKGKCSISIDYRHGQMKKKISVTIPFDTNYLSDKCCQTIDLDSHNDCAPVDCVMKYSGERNYFNHRTLCCEEVPCCTNKQVFIIESNSCKMLEKMVTETDLGFLERNETGNCNCPTMYNFICHQGQLANDSPICECNKNWITSPFDPYLYHRDLSIYHMCNVEVSGWNHANEDKIATTALLIVLFVISILFKILFVICILNCCYKWTEPPCQPISYKKIKCSASPAKKPKECPKTRIDRSTSMPCAQKTPSEETCTPEIEEIFEIEFSDDCSNL